MSLWDLVASWRATAESLLAAGSACAEGSSARREHAALARVYRTHADDLERSLRQVSLAIGDRRAS